ncbi:hypothetical protein HDU96_009073 [Phlyctochytrium bullatum]|nr:hypothetical protein HDU96_009073 [Phlyctochytrium bullatum]
MNRVFEVAEMTEDQQHSKVILHLHVTSRCILLSSAALSSLSVLASLLTRRSAKWPLFKGIARSQTAATLVGLGAGPVLTEVRMQGTQEIEWQDRAWRLLNSQSQIEVDEFAGTGMAVGAGMALLIGGIVPRTLAGWTRVLTWTSGGGLLGLAALGVTKNLDTLAAWASEVEKKRKEIVEAAAAVSSSADKNAKETSSSDKK